MYTKVHKTSFNGQGLTRKDDCFHGLLKDWTAAITIQSLTNITQDKLLQFRYNNICQIVFSSNVIDRLINKRMVIVINTISQ
jgi:hypothetical protein